MCISRRKATTSGRYAKAKSLAGFQGVLDPLVRFLAISWRTPRSSIKCFYRARSVRGSCVTSCFVTRSNQETRQDVPSWISLPLPLYKRSWGEKHKSFMCISRRKATTSGRYAKAKSLAGFQGVLDPLVRFLATSWGTPRSSIKCFYRAREAGRGPRRRSINFSCLFSQDSSFPYHAKTKRQSLS